MRTFFRGLGAAVVAGGLAVTVAPVASAAPASVTGTVVFDCTMPSFPTAPPFEYAAKVQLKGARATEGGPVTLSMTTSDLPGVVPPFISMKGQKVTVNATGNANGTAVKLSGSGSTDVNPTNDQKTKDPVKLPGLQGKASVSARDVTLSLSKFEFDVAGVAGTCKYKSGSLPTLTPELGSVPPEKPTPTATPTAKPTPTPTAKPTPTKKPTGKPTKKPSKAPAGKGKPIAATVSFDCMLKPFQSAFRYEGRVSVAGARAKEGDTKVSLVADLPAIPGIAPVPIDNGRMVASLKGVVDGKPVTFSSETTVNAAAKAKVPVKRATAEINTSATTAKVELESFTFKFDPLSNLEISADCQVSKGGVMGAMAISVGELAPEPPTGGGGGGGGDTGTGTGGNTAGGDTSLPRTGGGDAMPVIALWALALGVVGAGLLVWLPRRRAANQA